MKLETTKLIIFSRTNAKANQISLAKICDTWPQNLSSKKTTNKFLYIFFVYLNNFLALFFFD